MKKKGFTLVEMLLVVVISGSLFTTIYAIMTTLPKVKLFNDARMQLIEQSNDVMNRFAILFQDYTVDYEEYYNRQKVGVETQSGHYEKFTQYGNGNFLFANKNVHYIQYCLTDSCDLRTMGDQHVLSYGQYKAMFWNMGGDTDGQGRINSIAKGKVDTFPQVGDADDKDLGQGPEAISAGKIHELYLISHDGKRRLFLRRRCGTEVKSSCTIEILRLRGFDAGSEHKFSSSDSKTYDGEIDTWACDAGEGFICGGDPVSSLYPNYKLPKDANDGWVRLFDNAISIDEWNIDISPRKSPDYAWAENLAQLNPFITISFKASLKSENLHRVLGKMLDGYSFSLQSSFDTKSFYTQ